MKILNDLYDYNLKIYQDEDYFKFSLDSILLAEYIKLKNNDKIIDLCTGNAPIPLILSTKYDNEIYGIEIQNNVYNNAIDSITYNNLQEQIKIINDDVKNVKNYFPGNNFDVVSCNPPFFKYNKNALINEVEEKAISRHEIKVSLEELCWQINYLLKDNGCSYMVHRADRLTELTIILNNYGIAIKELVFIKTNKSAELTLVLIKAVKKGKLGVKVKCLDVQDLKTYKNIFD